MTVDEIYEGYDNSYVIVVCDNPDYIKRYGRVNNIESEKLYKFMSEVSEWCERELGEDYLFIKVY